MGVGAEPRRSHVRAREHHCDACEGPVCFQNAVMVQGGESHSLWILANGTVVACGTNKHGELGDNSHENSSTPRCR